MKTGHDWIPGVLSAHQVKALADEGFISGIDEASIDASAIFT